MVYTDTDRLLRKFAPPPGEVEFDHLKYSEGQTTTDEDDATISIFHQASNPHEIHVSINLIRHELGTGTPFQVHRVFYLSANKHLTSFGLLEYSLLTDIERPASDESGKSRFIRTIHESTSYKPRDIHDTPFDVNVSWNKRHNVFGEIRKLKGAYQDLAYAMGRLDHFQSRER